MEPSSDKTGERVWHCVIPFAAMVVGLGLAAAIADPTAKMVVLCIAAWGFFSILPVFWTLPTAFLSGVGGRGGNCRGQLDRQSGRLFRPADFRLSENQHGRRYGKLIFLAISALIGIVLVLSLGHNRALERAAAHPAE